MKKNFVNVSHIEGYLYEHSLELKTSGPNSKNPGTPFISGEIRIATDNARLNIVPIHFTYVTAVTAKGSANATFTILNNIINGSIGTIMNDGIEKAGKLRVDSAIALNEFYSNRNGSEELVSVKRNEGGFVHTTDTFSDNEKMRSAFDCDMLITAVTHVDANEERGYPEKATIKGAIFDFRGALLPVEFSAVDPRAIAYFEGLNASQKEPVFTRVKGYQVSETVVTMVKEESAFGDAALRESRSSHKDFVINWAQPEPYVFDSEDTLTPADLTKMIADRETYLATQKQRQEEYRKQRDAQNSAFGATAPTANAEFKF